MGTELVAKTPAVITTPDEYTDALKKWQGHYNILTPFTNVSGIAASFGIIASVVKIDTDLVKGEVYSGTTATGAKAMPFLKGERGQANEEFALAKIGLRKIAECGGISTSTTRTDPRTIPNYWEFKATASYRGLDGSLITREATFEWDLRDGSDRMKGWQANQITEGRKNGLRACEARAINAAIRECGCGVKQKYTRAELDKPFLVVRIAFQPDMGDPDIKRMVTQQQLSGVSTLYPAPHPLPASDIDEDEPRHVGSGTTEQAGAPTGKTVPDRFGLIQKIEAQEVKKRAGGSFLKWTVIDARGVVHVTTSQKTFETLDHCWKNKIAVDIISEENDYQENVITLVENANQPSLPGVDSL